jgi:hypothetical protein
MFKIQETISHGDYRSVRVMEVYAINGVTVDALVQSSAYCYGSLANDKDQNKLDAIVDGLKSGKRVALGWSDFKVIE